MPRGSGGGASSGRRRARRPGRLRRRETRGCRARPGHGRNGDHAAAPRDAAATTPSVRRRSSGRRTSEPCRGVSPPAGDDRAPPRRTRGRRRPVGTDTPAARRPRRCRVVLARLPVAFGGSNSERDAAGSPPPRTGAGAEGGSGHRPLPGGRAHALSPGRADTARLPRQPRAVSSAALKLIHPAALKLIHPAGLKLIHLRGESRPSPSSTSPAFRPGPPRQRFSSAFGSSCPSW